MPSAILVRHALSTWNLEGRWQGQADPPLAPEGEDQARAAAARVGPFDLAITSGLARARRTAELLAPGVPQWTVPDLAEFDVGAWSGRTRAEIEAAWPTELARFDAGTLDRPPGGESRSDFDARVGAGARQAAELILRNGASALVATHGGVLRALARAAGWPDVHVAHLCGYEAEVKGGTLRLERRLDLLGEAAKGAPQVVDPMAL